MKKTKKALSNNRGFSLIELIIVIAILAILIGVLAPNLLRYMEKSKEAKRLANADTLRRCYELATIEALSAGITPPSEENSNNLLLPDGENNDQPWNKAILAILTESYADIHNLDKHNIELLSFIYLNPGIQIYITYAENGKLYKYSYISSDADPATSAGMGSIGYEKLPNSDWYYRTD